MDNNEQVIDSTTTETQEQETEITLEETTDEETVESLKAKLYEANAKLEKEAEARRQLTARAKTAEAKAVKPIEKPQQINNGIDLATMEKTILKSQGMSDDLLGELVALSKVRGKSLLDTQSDPIFIALKDAKDAEAKKAKANLGASKGSGTVKTTKGFDTPGLSVEEHKEMWKQSQGR
jgi:hypothetical protein